MKLVYDAVEVLPMLAWIARCDFGRNEVLVRHGKGVETRETFFIEGVWDGPFERGDLANTDCVFGSGCVLDGNGTAVWFVPSTATTDSLYYRKQGDHWWAANSLVVLLAYTGDELDPQFTGYADVNFSVTKGIKKYERRIKTRQGEVERLLHNNLELTAGGAREVEKPMPPSFAGYAEYRDYLHAKMAALFANARAPQRRAALPILTTQSKGYDSTAINALTAKLGIDRAYTVSQGKAPGYHVGEDRARQVDDDGSEICRVLGIPCKQIDRRSFEKSFEFEVELFSGGDDNQDANFNDILRDVDRPSLLLVGTLGEIWYRAETYRADGFVPDCDLVRWDIGNHGLGEVRLVVGLITVAPIYLGARRRDDIERITESAEMTPWRLNTTYDRPIPRRMAEENGVPRELFGQVKTASVVEFSKPPIPIRPALRKDYFDFLVHNRRLWGWQTLLLPTIQRLNWALLVAGPTRYPLIHYTNRILSRVVRRDYGMGQVWRRLNGSLFCFCVNRRVEALRRVLDGRA